MSSLNIARLDDNEIRDLAPFLELPNLSRLNLVGNPVDCAAQDANLAALRDGGTIVDTDCP
jgi:Leucine-rich repeat (LRR) protein